ncbi:MAG TPA: serine hydrolase [Candidatus Angelobacter sp.]
MRRERWLSTRIAAGFLSLVSICFMPCPARAGWPQPVQGQETGGQDATKALNGFDDFVAQAMKDWKVPGVAVAIVQGDKVILLRGYGYRDVEKKLPVTPKTLFSIGSITKSFTVSTLGMEMDEGKVDWDKPVREHLPGFRMFEPTVTEQLTIRDMVTHRSGLPRHDLVWYTSDFSREDLIRRLQYLELSKPLRYTFQYNNLMFMTAGYVAGRLDGMSWEDVIKKRIFTPLGMNGTTFSYKDSQNSPDFALPYRKGSDLKAEVKRIPFDPTCPDRCAIGPAGEINSSAADMSHYLLFHLNKGKYEGKQLLSANNATQMQTPQMVIQGAPDYKETSEASYGMGFFISAYRGHKQVEHGGNIDGFSADLTFLPNDGIGVVVLTNLDGTPLPDVIALNVFDRFLGMDQVPWSKRFLDAELKGKQSEEEAKSKGYVGRKVGTHPSQPLGEYVGDYENPGYGIISISPDADGFKMKFNQLERTLRHYHYDSFQVPENPFDVFEKLIITFQTDNNGEISTVSLPVGGVKPAVFTRMPDRQLSQRSFIEAFAGKYEIPGSPTPATVELRGDNTLFLTFPGSPARKLMPKRGTTFGLESAPNVNLEFKRDAGGKVTELVVHTPGNAQIFKRLQ